MSGVKRRRLDLPSWREVMRRFEAAGTSVQAFCTNEGLSTTSFYRWRERVDDEVAVATRQGTTPALRTPSAAGFVELGSLLAGGGGGSGGGALELKLDLGGGVLLTLSRR